MVMVCNGKEGEKRESWNTTRSRSLPHGSLPTGEIKILTSAKLQEPYLPGPQVFTAKLDQPHPFKSCQIHKLYTIRIHMESPDL